jgi:hypothetical protein
MISAITSGIMASNVDDLSADCPTGDCDWPTMNSLAVCGGCQAFATHLDEYKNKTDFEQFGSGTSTKLQLVEALSNMES